MSFEKELNEIRRRAGLNEIFGLFGKSDEDKADDLISDMDSQAEQFERAVYNVLETVENTLAELEDQEGIIEEKLETGADPYTGEVIDDATKKQLMAKLKEVKKDFKIITKQYAQGEKLGQKIEEYVSNFRLGKLQDLGHPDMPLARVEKFAQGQFQTFRNKYIAMLKKLGDVTGVNLQFE